MDYYVTRMTLLTMTWIKYNHHEEEFARCDEPEEMRRLTYKLLLMDPGESLDFDKGNKLINYNAIFQWFKKSYKKRSSENLF